MKIGIDARLYGLEHAGLGRYVMKLVQLVIKMDKKNKYVLFLNSRHVEKFRGKKRIKVVECNIPIYSFSEQVILPFVFAKEKLDLLHVPHFNAPLLYSGKYILTIHDLIKHASVGPATTTHNQLLYFLKRTGYLLLTSLISARAMAVLVPSKFVKEDVIKKLHTKPEKITVTYEAVDSSLQEVVLDQSEKKEILQKYGLTQPFIVYTGSVYPHKNVDVLIEAIGKHNKVKEVDLELALICSRSVFWDRTNKKINDKGISNWIKMLGFVDDCDVSKLYSLALALVHPSKMEGFGLTGLEAMSVGLPVISSNASCLPEVYGEAALYFSPDNIDELVARLEELIKDSELRESLSERGYLQARKYSWEKMSEQTIAVYQNVLKK